MCWGHTCLGLSPPPGLPHCVTMSQGTLYTSLNCHARAPSQSLSITLITFLTIPGRPVPKHALPFLFQKSVFSSHLCWRAPSQIPVVERFHPLNSRTNAPYSWEPSQIALVAALLPSAEFSEAPLCALWRPCSSEALQRGTGGYVDCDLNNSGAYLSCVLCK